MHAARIFAALLFAGLATACADLPTTPSGEQVTVVASGPSMALEPIVVVGICDPELSLDQCGQGGGDCMTSTEFTLRVDDFASVSGCGTGTGGGGGTPPGTQPPPPSSSAYQEGPLTWGICVLAVLGSAYSIDQVAGAFQGWWTAQTEYESAKRMLDALQANSQNIDPATMQLWEFQVEYYRDRRDEAMAGVSEKTGASYWALGTAALSCGAALFLPTP